MSVSISILFSLFIAAEAASTPKALRTYDDCPVDLCFVIDRSPSIGIEHWKSMKSFIENVVTEMTISDENAQVGMVTFASFGNLVFDFTEYTNNKTAMIEAIHSAEYFGMGASTDYGLYKARTECFVRGNRLDFRDVAVLVTDGVSRLFETANEVRLLREEGVSVIAVGVGNGTSRQQLRAIAVDDNDVFSVEDFSQLVEEADLIRGRICSDRREPQYSEWSDFGPCSKSCGFGIQVRKRSCLESQCSGQLTETRSCNTIPCPERDEKAKNELIIELYGLFLDKVTSIESLVCNIILSLMNEYTVKRPMELCVDIKLRPQSDVISGHKAVFDENDLRIASGYWKNVSETAIWVQLLVTASRNKVADICVLEEVNGVIPQSYDVSAEYLRGALAGFGKELSQIVGQEIKVMFELPTTTRTNKEQHETSLDVEVIAVVAVIASCLTAAILLTGVLLLLKYRTRQRKVVHEKAEGHLYVDVFI